MPDLAGSDRFGRFSQILADLVDLADGAYAQ